MEIILKHFGEVVLQFVATEIWCELECVFVVISVKDVYISESPASQVGCRTAQDWA
jgi:hypothetical protein